MYDVLKVIRIFKPLIFWVLSVHERLNYVNYTNFITQSILSPHIIQLEH